MLLRSLVFGFLLLSASIWSFGENLLVPEDYPTIQAAIDAANPGDTVVIAAGVYEEHLTITKELTLVGAGPWKTVLVRVRDVIPMISIDGVGETTVTISGLTLVRTQIRPGQEYDENGIVVKGEALLEVSNSVVFNQRGAGIAAVEGAHVAVRDSHLLQNDKGVSVRDEAFAEIYGSSICGNKFGVIASSFGQAVVERSFISNNEQGVLLKDCAVATLRNNLVKNNGDGIVVWFSARAHVEGNRIVGNGTGVGASDKPYAFRLAQCDQTLKITLEDNEIISNEVGIHAIGFSSQILLELIGNEITDNTGDAVSLGGLARAKVRNNRILNNGGSGIAAGPDSLVAGETNEISGNGCDLAGNVPPEVRSVQEFHVAQNEIHVPRDFPTLQSAVDAIPAGGTVYVHEGTYKGGITIWKPVRLIGVGEASLVGSAIAPVISLLQGVDDVTIEGITISGGEHGVLAYGSGTIDRCRIVGNQIGGITSQADAKLQVDNCEISANLHHGVYVAGDSEVTLTNTAISRNETGLIVGSSVSIVDGSITRNNVGIEVINGIGSGRDIIVQNNVTGVRIRGSANFGLVACQVMRNNDGVIIKGYPEVTQVQQGVTVTGEYVETIQTPSYPVVEISDTVVTENARWGIRAASKSTVEGRGNTVTDNGVDLEGPFPPGFREGLVPQTESMVLTFPGSYATLQDAIDAAPPGGRILVAPGKHEVKTVIITKPLTIEGSIQTPSVFIGQEEKPMFIVSNTEGQVRLVDLVFRGGKYGVLNFGSVAIDGCKFQNCLKGGVLVQGGEATVRKCGFIENNGNGVMVWGEAALKMEDSCIEGNGALGIYLHSDGQSTVSSSFISNNGGHGIFITAGKVSLAGNHIERNGKSGIFIKQFSPYSMTVSVHDNTIQHNDANGCTIDSFDDGSAITINENTIAGNVGSGIVVKHSSLAAAGVVRIKQNSIFENGDGVVLHGRTLTELTANRIFNNDRFGVALYRTPCFETNDQFTGIVRGTRNLFEGNALADVCPDLLDFLGTEAGGEYQTP